MSQHATISPVETADRLAIRELVEAFRVGLTIGLVVAVLSAFTSFIEWGSDHVPQKSMGVFGVALILVGFSLQSFQYWATLFDWSAH